MPELTQQDIAHIIDLAVTHWHGVADEHDFPHCNYFREAFAKAMIEEGFFIGYDNYD